MMHGKHTMPGGRMMAGAKMDKPKRTATRSTRRDQSRKPTRGSSRY